MGPDRTAAPLSISLFGTFEARLNGVPLPRLRTRKGEWLLALLTLRHDREVERGWLAGTFWPDSPDRLALGSLRMSLKDLRRALGPEASRLRSSTPHSLSLDLQEAAVDVVAFDTAIARGDPAALAEAVALYRGPLLEGWVEEWVFQERQVREQAYLRALETLAAGALASGGLAAAEQYLRQAAAVDPLRESTQRALMRALAVSGNYAAAMQVFRELRLRLCREINARPDAETQALFERLRAEARRLAAQGSGARAQGAKAGVGGQGSGVSSGPSLTPDPPCAGSSLSLTPAKPLTPRKVVVLHQRHVQPDERLAKLLAARLGAAGCEVSADDHRRVGVEWARERMQQMRAAEIVVPLLSASSVESETLADELQMVYEASDRPGRPRLLPVWLGDPGPLPEPLASIIEPGVVTVWSGPEDDERLVCELASALHSPAMPGPRQTNEPVTSPGHPIPSSHHHPIESLAPAGGAVPLGSPLYVVRPADAEFGQAIARQDSIVLVKGARQMGKTSLLARALYQARQAGARVVCTDFQTLNAAHLESVEALLSKLADSIAYQLELDVPPEQVWHPRAGPSENLKRYWQRVALRACEAPIVWGLDEIDRLFSCPFAGEVFGLFRSWHNERALDPEAPWHRLTIAMAYATEAHLFITEVHQSPFNVGTRLTLEDFTGEQVADLNERYGSPLRGEAELGAYYRLVGGQPYLVQRGLHHMVTHDLTFPALEGAADRDEGIFGDHLRRMLLVLGRDAELCEVVRGVLQGRPCPTAESFYRLRSAGVLAGESAQDARPRCQLYAAFLGRHLL